MTDTGSKPFDKLPARRNINGAVLPVDLAEFYREYEGIGLKVHPDNPVRLCTLEEVKQIRWSDLHIFGTDEPLAGWEQFSGYRVGISSFFDEIIYVLKAPSCPPGSMIVLGLDIMGPGGDGPHVFECSLVLASSFENWIKRLEEKHWLELGLAPGEVEKLQPAERAAAIAYYKSLNPLLEW